MMRFFDKLSFFCACILECLDTILANSRPETHRVRPRTPMCGWNLAGWLCLDAARDVGNDLLREVLDLQTDENLGTFTW